MEHKLEVLGMVCPFPLMEAKKEMEQLNKGDILAIEFDCTQATETIPRWADECGHEILEFDQTGDATWSIRIKKA